MREHKARVSVRVEHKKYSQARGQRRHNERVGNQPGYVDSSRTHLNSVLIKAMTESDLRDECNKRFEEKNNKKRHVDAAILTDGIITFSHEASPIINGLTVEQQNALFLKTAQEIAKRLNTDVISLVVHRDETQLHAHFGLTAVDHDGKNLSRTIKSSVAKELQDIAGSVFSEVGIERGIPKKQRVLEGEDWRKTTHRTVRQLHQDMPVELAEKQEELDAIEKKLEDIRAKAEKNERLAKEAESKLLEANLTVEKAHKLHKNISIYEKRTADALALIDSLELKHEELLLRVSELERMKKGLEPIVAAMDSALDQMEEQGRRLETREAILDDKEKRLNARDKAIKKREKELGLDASIIA